MTTKKKSPKTTANKSGKTPKRVNSFAPKKYEEHTLVDSDKKIIGHIRVKPNSILWSPKNGKDWYGISLAEFADFLEKNGKKQSK
jgi:hypothetical protein